MSARCDVYDTVSIWVGTMTGRVGARSIVKAKVFAIIQAIIRHSDGILSSSSTSSCGNNIYEYLSACMDTNS